MNTSIEFNSIATCFSPFLCSHQKMPSQYPCHSQNCILQ